MRYIVHLVLLGITIVACKNDNSNTSETIEKEIVSQIQPLNFPAPLNSALPRLFSNGESLYASFVTSTDTADVLSYSQFVDDRWGTPETIISGADWFTNWADFPAIASSGGNLLTSFLEKSADGTYTYDIKLNLFQEATQSWKKDFILHHDGTKSEHGFVSMQPYVANSFVVSWLDGRETVGKGHGGGQMTLRAAIVFEDGTIDHETLLDDRVCDCCPTTTAIGSNDEILVAYRDRSEDEIRDISLVKWTRENAWSTPKTIGEDGWKIAGCPVNGPSMDVFNDQVVISWFTAVGDESKVNVVFSEDLGDSFGKVHRIDAGNATGRVDVVMISDTEAAVLWMEPKGTQETIQLVKISNNGTKGNPITVAETSAERASGFPQLERFRESLYIAWTTNLEGIKKINTAKIEIVNL